jgi:hypothetical protein
MTTSRSSTVVVFADHVVVGGVVGVVVVGAITVPGAGKIAPM